MDDVCFEVMCCLMPVETFLCICEQILAAQTLQLVLLFTEKFYYALIFSLKTKRVELVQMSTRRSLFCFVKMQVGNDLSTIPS